VQNRRRVLSHVLLSPRIAYPTAPTPTRGSPRSAATRSATPMAEMRRGCVQMMFTGVFVSAACSRMYCATCVVFPLPVSPSTIVTGFFANASISAGRWRNTGNERRTAPCGPPSGGGGGANSDPRT